MLNSLAFILACWLCMIAVVGLTRVYDSAPPQAIALTVAGGTLLLLALAKFIATFRRNLDSITTEQFICVHSIRAPIGAAFLVMADEGLLPGLFANRAGFGDIVTAIAGLLAIAVCNALVNQRSRTVVYVVWNLFGLADLLLAVGTGIYMALQVPDSMIWIARLPLLLVPTFVLPILFASHFIMLHRLTRTPERPTAIA